MNTPAHIAASLLSWRDEKGWSACTAVTAGAIIPDLPMFGFYAWQKLVVGSSEKEIWSTLYFQENWQFFFDIFNSMPIAIGLMVLFRAIGFQWGLLFAASALLHLCFDLPLHNDDAHRHFLPISNWRFESPFSYWDPKHFGIYFASIELLFAVVTCSYLGWNAKSKPFRVVACWMLSIYGLALVVAISFWVKLGCMTNLFNYFFS